MPALSSSARYRPQCIAALPSNDIPNMISYECLDIIEDIMLVSKWGNSLAVRLPKKLVEEMKLQSGDELAIVTAENHKIAVDKIDRRKAALERMATRNWRLPEGYRFDRDEANER